MRTICLCIVSVILATQSVTAQGFGGKHGPPQHGGQQGGGDRMGMLIERIIKNGELAEELGLNEEQVETISNAIYKQKIKEIDLKASLQKAGLNQARLLMADEIDEEAVLAAVDKAGKIKTKLAKLKVEQLIMLKSTLTDDQIDEAKSMMRNRMRKHMQERQKGRKSNRGPERGGGRPEGRPKRCAGACPTDGPPLNEEPNETE